jgi:hypothetical protein
LKSNRVSDNTLNNIAISHAGGSLVNNFATSYAQTRFSNFSAGVGSSGGYRGAATALSMALSGSSLSTTIGIAMAAIQLAQAVIASYKSPSSH